MEFTANVCGMAQRPLSTEGPSRPLVVRITPSIDRALKARSNVDGRSIADIVRSAIEREIATS